MSKRNFYLSTEQLELLLAFEEAGSLQTLAKIMGRDPSVISRQLQRLIEARPVIKKENGKWVITSLGQEVNRLSLNFLAQLETILEMKKKTSRNIAQTALVIVNAQQGMLQKKLDRSNPEAENNIIKILKQWRLAQAPIIHVKHISENAESLFYKDSCSSDFMQAFMPVNQEVVIEKKLSSSFTGTSLLNNLQRNNIFNLVIVGFTANECIEATAKDAHELSFTSTVIGDATAMFDLKGPDGKIYSASKIHELVLANINALYAKVENTESFIESIDLDF